MLAASGYLVAIRTALSGHGADCFKSLRHEFLVVRGTGEFRGMEFIVEPSLRQHFLIPHPSPEYEYVLSRTPDVFVGGSCRLAPLVQLLCALMADSFQRQGLPLPPWRKEAAMLSKWLPQPHRTRDTPVLPPPAAAAAAAMVFPTPDESVGDRTALAAAALSRGYILPPPPPPGHLGPQAGFFDLTAADSAVCRTDSEASTDSCDGFAACDISPVSVLRLPAPPPPPPLLPAADGAMTGARGPRTMSAAKLPAAVHRGFEPPAAPKPPSAAPQRPKAAPTAAAAGGRGCAASEGATGVTAVSACRRRERRRSTSTSGSCCFGGGSASGVDSGLDGATSASASTSTSINTNRTGGLLSVQMLQEQQQRPAAAAAAAAAAASGGGGGGDCGGTGRIRTHPPVHRGEMAIRVVKLVDFAVPDGQGQPAAQQQPEQRQRQQQPLPPGASTGRREVHFQALTASPAPTAPAVAAATTAAAAAGPGAGVPWGRDTRLGWTARQRTA
ncbi:hypothetical protein PLESTM_001756700 [Pleodorina starrii]|nr:hypothetical protein PLESTM_001756700 [Pleodorina starrii]